jgi:small-conductance mechanosensitive channel
MNNWIHEISQTITPQHIFNLCWAAVILVGGAFIARKSESTVSRLSQLDFQQRILFSRFTKYGIFTLAIAAALNQLGFDLKVILGAAGVLTVAIGFAAQTSASNLISGIFLMVERPFVVGDAIKVADFSGTVVSVDMLSSKIRTFDNLMVRIPNETLVKSNIINYSFFPVRRADLSVNVAYSANIERVEQILREAALANPLCLNEPEPIFVFDGFGESAMKAQILVFTVSDNLQILKNELYADIKRRFDNEGIQMPYPTRVLVMAQPEARI